MLLNLYVCKNRPAVATAAVNVPPLYTDEKILLKNKRATVETYLLKHAVIALIT